MSYLLDTHSFIWSIHSPNNLSFKVKQIILSSSESILVSVVSFWEISLKYSLGKLELENITPDKLVHVAHKSGFELVPLNPSMAASFHQLPRKLHRDPFDRMLIWHAIQLKCPIISKDDEFKAYQEDGLEVVW